MYDTDVRGIAHRRSACVEMEKRRFRQRHHLNRLRRHRIARAQLGRQNRRPPHRNFGHQNGGKRARSAYAQHTENYSARMEEIPLGATAHDRQVVYRSKRLGFCQQRWRIAYIHRHEDDIPTPYESERLGAVQAPLSLLAAHLFEYALRVARKPESHPNAARSQGRYDDNPYLQQRRPLLLQASRRQTRLEIPLRQRLKKLCNQPLI